MGSGNTPLPTTISGSHALSMIANRSKKRDSIQNLTISGANKSIQQKTTTYNPSKQDDQQKNEEDGSANGDVSTSRTTENSADTKAKKN